MTFPRCKILLSNYETAVPSEISDHEIVNLFREQSMGDGFCCWLDHMNGKMDPPEPLPGEDLVVTFWPNDPYNPRRARQRGISLDEYIDLRLRQCLEYRDKLGERFQCCMGWETFEPRHWCQADGSEVVLESIEDALEFHRQWVRTSMQNLHWRTSKKFAADYPRTRKIDGLLGFLEERGIPPERFNVMAGNRNPVMAHPTFEVVPEAGSFWWECLHSAASGIQIGIPFVRGAARQYRKKWLCDIAPYSSPAPVYPDKYYENMGEWKEMEGILSGEAKPRMNHPRYTEDMIRLAGYSVEMAQRCWITALFAGCDWLFQEASSVTHLIKTREGNLKLTPYGEAARNLAAFNRRLADRGKPYVPVTLLLDVCHGVEPHQNNYKPWGWMEHTPGTRQILAFFNAAYPGHGDVRLSEKPYHSPEEHAQMLLEGRDMRDVEQRHLLAGRWPDMFDALTAQASDDVIQESEVLFLMGPHSDKRTDESRLRSWIEQGRTLIATVGTLSPPPAYFPGVDADCLMRNGWIDGRGVRHACSEYAVCPLTEDAEEVLLRSDKGEPIVVRRRMGRGSLVFVAVPSGLDQDGNLAAPLLSILDDACRDLFPFVLSGPPLQRSCTTIPGGHMLLLVNHDAKDWHGEVLIKNGTVESVCDCWQQAELEIARQADTEAVVRPLVPAYGFAILEVKYRS